MIAYIDGKLTHKSPALVHIEVNGLGYEVQISLNTYSKIQSLNTCRLHTYLHIKEDAHTLYGFFDIAEKEVFLDLLSVSGVGASTARMILSSMQPEEVQRAILQENEKVLEQVKGIGAKTAKRLILELKDKLSKHKDAIQISAITSNTITEDALNALIALGIARHAAETAISKAMKTVPRILSLEELVKQSLKSM